MIFLPDLQIVVLKSFLIVFLDSYFAKRDNTLQLDVLNELSVFVFPDKPLTNDNFLFLPKFCYKFDWSHMGREHASREKKCTMVNFFIFVQKNVSRIRFQEIKIRP